MDSFRGMLTKKDYQTSDKLFSFMAALVDRSTDYEKTLCMTRTHTSRRDIFADLTEDKRQYAWGRKNSVAKKMFN